MTKATKVFRPEDVPESNATGYPEPYRAMNMMRHARRIGEFGGLTNFGVNLVRIEPGGQSSARHAHLKQDEVVLILDGDITLETNEGEQIVTPGTYITFPAGTGDAHRFVNKTKKDVVFLVVGDKTREDVVTYPDIDMHGVGGADGIFRYYRKDGTLY
jgi:uncharacterized cupin superfamily protein